MTRKRSRGVALLLGVLVLTLFPAAFAGPAGADSFTPGSPGLGDPFFPLAATAATTLRTTR